jgi:hypothetical protein
VPAFDQTRVPRIIQVPSIHDDNEVVPIQK